MSIHCLKGKGSSPLQVLGRMKNYIKQEGLKVSDEAWLIVDKDQWSEADLNQLHAWAEERVNYGLAVSNPQFEYWLLLHFEDGHDIANAQDCMTRLKRHLPHYDKGVEVERVTAASIEAAVKRAEQRDNPPCKDWPRKPGSTTVYRLVRKILAMDTASDGPPAR